MAATPPPQTLEEWRLYWPEIEWRETIEWREERATERSLRRRMSRRRDRIYFGEDLFGVSADHRKATYQPEKLNGLPELSTEGALAEWLNIDLSRLRWFTHDKPADTTWHYIRFIIPKRSGGQRVILAPKRELKALQRHLLRHLLDKVTPSDEAHGFTKTRSIVTNAAPHIQKKVIINLDLKDFFPSITFPRVRGLFISLGYSYSVAATLALICTEYDREPIEHDDTTYFVTIGERHLIQGAPTSPTLANLIARKLDRRLSGLAKKYDFTYTRYADDLTFSGDDTDAIAKILHYAPQIITAEGFTINETKTRIYRESSRQIVTGLVVNEKTAVPRKVRRTIRAMLHNASKTGLESHQRGYLAGIIAHIHQADPAHAAPLREKLNQLS